MKTVAVLGGGVGGLSAAHELAERGFKVTVYEMHDAFGGKARSMDKPCSGKDDRPNLPGEHGFRFFPNFYTHILDTMKRIEYDGKTVADNLVPTTQMLLAQGREGKELPAPMVPPSSVDDLIAALKFMREFVFGLGIPMHEFRDYAMGLLTLLVSCDARRKGQWERMSWWDFMVRGRDRTEAFEKFLADGMTRCLVAARGREMSALTGGMITLRLMLDNTDVPTDRVLNGPTSEVWIDPWVEYLRNKDVDLLGGHTVGGIHCDGRKITGITVVGPRGNQRVTADYYIAAMPKEKLELLISPQMCTADPNLAKVSKLQTRWMNGAMFYLDTDKPLINGHIVFIDSEWSLTAISQKQFWKVDLTERGDGRVEGILSVDISDWRTPGKNGKVASACTAAEIRAEVWKQMEDHIEDGSLDERNVVDFFLDPAISFPGPAGAMNAEPLLINTPGSWEDRPKAETRIPNFFLAADFVQTDTDLATMEAANEAARLAVNAILKAERSKADPCWLWTFPEPRVLAPFRLMDRVLWRLGRKPPKPPVQVTPRGEVKPTGRIARTVAAGARLGR
ncbi:FAD-dependent oxidoreductase [Mycolicibacterium novocastrense]|nr:FAD-dependent oxidoreductase [Mycolicibacterium novocastrense]